MTFSVQCISAVSILYVLAVTVGYYMGLKIPINSSTVFLFFPSQLNDLIFCSDANITVKYPQTTGHACYVGVPVCHEYSNILDQLLDILINQEIFTNEYIWVSKV